MYYGDFNHNTLALCGLYSYIGVLDVGRSMQNKVISRDRWLK